MRKIGIGENIFLQLQIQRRNHNKMGRQDRDVAESRPIPLGGQPTNRRIITIEDILPQKQGI